MKTKKLTNEEINYNVLNALNLYSEDLGNCYLNGTFNPFDYNFVLTEDFVIERIENFGKERERHPSEDVTVSEMPKCEDVGKQSLETEET